MLQHDIRSPFPPSWVDFDYVIHAAGIASPTYYRLHPIETMDANVVGLRLLLDRVVERSVDGEPTRRLPLLLEQRDLRRSRRRTRSRPPRPTAETCPARARAPATTSRSGTARRCASTSPGSTACPVRDGAAVQQLRAGPQADRSPRHPGPRPATCSAGRDLTLLSDGAATRTFCYVADAVTGYYKVLVRGRPGEPYNIGTEEPEVSMGELADRIASARRRARSGIGEGRPSARAPTGSTSSTTR